MAEYTEAALRIVTRDGLPAVSFRTVAAESGWSLGSVQKAFPTKNDLLAATLAHAQQRVVGQVGPEPGRPTLFGWLVDLVLATLPLDDERRSAVLIGVAFSDRAPFDSDIAASLAAWDTELRDRLCLLFARAQHEGELSLVVDRGRLARSVLALAAGLATQLLYDPAPPSEVEATVAQAIGSLLTGGTS
ncbi:MAG: TetR/AcrR family transcriptional regulator [Propionibacteriaceae bacterium]